MAATADRDAYREAKRQDAERHLDELLSQDGWNTWLRLRRNLHSYSWGNQILIAVQAHEQHTLAELGDPAAPDTPCSPTPTIVKAPWKWKLDGYHPAKGTRGLYIWAYRNRRRKDGIWNCCGKPRRERNCPECQKADHYFVISAAFDASQVRSFETGQAPDIDIPEGEPITGDDPGQLLVDGLCDWAVETDLVAEVHTKVQAPRQGVKGWWDPTDRSLHLVDDSSHNALLRVLIHELAHAKGISSKTLDLTYDECEVAVECVSYIVASTAGLDTASEAIPYIAGWGGADARDKVRALAKLIDETAKQLEEPILALLDKEQS